MLRRPASLILSMMLSAGWLLGGSSDDFRIARLSYIEGNVSFQHANQVDWSAASVNLALQVADRIYTSEDGRAEIQFDDGSVLRLAERTDVEILSLREDLIQLRVLVGLTTLSVHSSIPFEINTPSAAFTTVRKGVYRFDVLDNGDADAIVRKGLLDAANNNFSQRVEAGELVHVTGGDRGTYTVSTHRDRDEWDEWNDRRDADLVAYESRRYLPAYVAVGINDLDRYGRWVVVDEYGPAWVPRYVDVGWSPYWDGRWYYRPTWGWTWISYEPWGWLPYHYGRWYHNISVGWCWIPGPAFGFRFWSPGLVRFYQGPGWLSWCPLGPGDYYNVNNYYFNSTYLYQLNHMRLVQNRGPNDLVNRNTPGAFRTARVDQFTRGTPVRTIASVAGSERPWLQGRIVTDRLRVQPSPESYSPLANRQSRVTTRTAERPVVVRTEPGPDAGRSVSGRYTRITSPTIAPVPASRFEREPAGEQRVGSYSGRSAETALPRNTARPGTNSGYWNRRPDIGAPEDTGPGERPGYRNPSSPGEASGRSRVFSRSPSEARSDLPQMSPRGSGSLPDSRGRALPESRSPNPDRTWTGPRGRSESSPAPPAPPSNRFDRNHQRTPSPQPRAEPPARRIEPQMMGATSSRSFGDSRASFSRGEPRGSIRNYYATPPRAAYRAPGFSTGPAGRPDRTIGSSGMLGSRPGGFSRGVPSSQSGIRSRSTAGGGFQGGSRSRPRPD